MRFSVQLYFFSPGDNVPEFPIRHLQNANICRAAGRMRPTELRAWLPGGAQGTCSALPSAWGPCHVSAVSSSQPHSINESVLVCCGCSWIVKQKWNPCTLSYLSLGRITLLLDLGVGREGEGQMLGWGWPSLMWVSLEKGRESRPLAAEQSRIPSLWARGALKMSQTKCLISLSAAVSRIHCGREGPSSRPK